MTVSTWIVLAICCFICPMGMFTVMNSKKKNEKSDDKKDGEKNND